MHGERVPISLENLQEKLWEGSRKEEDKDKRVRMVAEEPKVTTEQPRTVAKEPEAEDAEPSSSGGIWREIEAWHPTLDEIAEEESSPPSTRRRRRKKKAVLTVPEGTVVIPARAYYNRDDLVKVVLPSTLRSIGESAFESCENLEEVNFPDGLRTINDSAFACCDNLEGVVIPGSVKQVGEYAFMHCDSLTRLKICDGVRQLGRGAFSYCVSLTRFHKWNLPKSIGKWIRLADGRLVPTWLEVFAGSPCVLTLAEKYRKAQARKWAEKLERRMMYRRW